MGKLLTIGDSKGRGSLLRVAEAAAVAGMTLDEFRGHARRGNFPEGMLIHLGRTVRVRRHVFDAWLGGELTGADR